ncbi:MAG TPA: MarR family winged helix-turn-helix transcriptional regulator [Solirubrobacteraceae bacterium]|nr:MarR family winged helix-turn-helix transcriptional regulator [Solirubrobacteraceae bacterium]
MWEDGPIPDELGMFPGYLMARLGEASRRRFHKALEPEGLHPRHFGVMTMVAAHPGMSQQQLHEKTAIDPSSMVSVIDELEARAAIAWIRAAFGQAARFEHGEGALERVRGLAAQLQREFFGGLTAEELRTLHSLLRKLAGSVVSKQATPRTQLSPARPGAGGAGPPVS